ncbi:hypothetical protein PFLU4_59510 [Pseudomonas fluorescens]|nr:hypothetical protein PFLU4_59510 [Pseudomonas fluorescens]RDI04991.1 hypothetical protein DFO59_104313 [Pseudomonas fluorescens]
MSVPIRVAHAVAQISMFKGLAAHFLGAISPHRKHVQRHERLPFWATACTGTPPMLGHKNA